LHLTTGTIDVVTDEQKVVRYYFWLDRDR